MLSLVVLSFFYLALVVPLSLAKEWDYIIVGGGISGLTLANRLSEDSSKTVLVLEAGGFHSDDPQVAIPGFLGSTLGNTTLDWGFTTVAQKYSNGTTYAFDRGKGLGGSSLINFLAWERPSMAEIDAIAGLGNPGWEASELFKYMMKAEKFTYPSQTYAKANDLTYIASDHGESGPLLNSYPAFISAAQGPWIEAMNALGVPHNQDAFSGNNLGVWMAPATINAETQTRWDAASAFYTPISTRTNLVVETDAEVLQLITSSAGGNVSATGVLYTKNGTTITANVNSGGEVILSAGAVKTPQLLELSGIGDPRILQPLGIDVTVSLPGVGNGVIDQFFFAVSYELNNNSIVTLDNLRNTTYEEEALAEYYATKTGICTVGVNNLVAEQALKIDFGDYTETEKERMNTIIDGIHSGDVGQVEVLGFPGFFTSKSEPTDGQKYLTFTGDLQFPFSFGSIHITSTNSSVQPAIDPGYFKEDFDVTVAIATLKFIRQIATTGGFKEMLGAELDPGMDTQTDAEILEYIQTYGGTEYHTVGSASMLPQDKGGVVSPQLLVYGTRNIRVVDMSILPLQISAHPMSTLYGVSEKAADIIMGVVTV